MPLYVPMLVLGGTILLGFLARIAFERTRIPDVLILMGLGMLLGDSLSPEARLLIYRFAPYFGTLALIMILFEGGLHIDPRRAFTQAQPAVLLSALSLFVSALLLTAWAQFIWGWALTPALLFGLVLGCTSSAIVIPVAQRLAVSDGTRTLLGLDAAFSDTFAVVGLLTVVGLAESHQHWLAGGLVYLGRSLGIAAGFALAISLAWLLVLEYTKDRPLSYLLTFAVIVLLYGLVERWHGSGPIAVLLFGILITEARHLPRWIFIFGPPAEGASRQEASETLQWFHQELTFLVRTFFFVYLGLLFEPRRLTDEMALAVAALTALIVLGRAASVYLLRRPLAGHPLRLTTVFFPRGLVTAVLAALPAAHGIEGTARFMDYAVPVIVLTNIVMALGLLLYARSRPPRQP